MKQLVLATLVLGFSSLGVAAEFEGEERWVEGIDGTSIYSVAYGSGPDLIVVHGGPNLDHRYFLPHLEGLTATHRVIFYDQRLSGRSAANVDPSTVSLPSFVDDLDAVRQAWKLEQFDLAAHSWGAVIAMRYAMAHPDRVARLQLWNAMPPTAELWQQEQAAHGERKNPERDLRIEAIRSSAAYNARDPKTLEALLKIMLEGQLGDPSLIDQLDIQFPEDVSLRSKRFAAMMPELKEYDLLPGLKQLKMPTLILYGELEPAAQISLPAFFEAMPEARTELIEDCAHFPFLEQPERFTEIVLDHLEN